MRNKYVGLLMAGAIVTAVSFSAQTHATELNTPTDSNVALKTEAVETVIEETTKQTDVTTVIDVDIPLDNEEQTEVSEEIIESEQTETVEKSNEIKETEQTSILTHNAMDGDGQSAGTFTTYQKEARDGAVQNTTTFKLIGEDEVGGSLPSIKATLTNNETGEVFVIENPNGTTAILQEIPEGTYLMSFADIEGYTKPTDRNITMSGPSRRFTATYRTIKTEVETTTVTIFAFDIEGQPLNYVNATLKNNETGEEFTFFSENANSVTLDVPRGIYELQFGDLDGYKTPLSRTVRVNFETTELQGKYTKTEYVPIVTFKAVDDLGNPLDCFRGALIKTGSGESFNLNTDGVNYLSIEDLLVGTYLFMPGEINGYIAPPSERITIDADNHEIKATYKAKDVILPKTTGILATSYGKEGINLKWKQTKGAFAYNIYRKQGEGDRQFVTRTSNTTFFDADATGLDVNYYWVESVFDKDGKEMVSQPDQVVEIIAAPNKTPKVEAESTSQGVRLNWEPVSNIDGYLIYRKVRELEDHYKWYAITEKETFLDTNASRINVTQYLIYPYYKEAGKNVVALNVSDRNSEDLAWGYETGNAKPDRLTGFKARSDYGQVHLFWDKARNAEEYIIYRKIGKSGDLKYLMVTPNTSFIDQAPMNEYSFYWVFPSRKDLGRNIISSCPEYKYGKSKMVQPVKTIKGDSRVKGVHLEWDELEGAQHYGIGRLSIDKDNPCGKPTYRYIDYTTKTSYFDKNASIEGFNYYFVFPMFKNVYGQTFRAASPNYGYGKVITDTIVSYERETIPFDTVYEAVNKPHDTYEVVEIEGKPGVKSEKYYITNGKKDLVAAGVCKQPVTQKVIRGVAYAETVVMPIEIVEQEDPTLWEYERVVKDEGKAEVRENRYIGTLDANGNLVKNPESDQLTSMVVTDGKPKVILVGTKKPNYIDKHIDEAIPFDTEYVGVVKHNAPLNERWVKQEGEAGTSRTTYRIPVDPVTGKQITDTHYPVTNNGTTTIKTPINKIIEVNTIKKETVEYEADPIITEREDRWVNYRYVTKEGDIGYKNVTTTYDVDPKTGRLINPNETFKILVEAKPEEVTVGRGGRNWPEEINDYEHGKIGYMWEGVEQEFLDCINADRVERGLEKVMYLQDLVEISRERSYELSKDFQHIAIIDDRPYDFENIARNSIRIKDKGATEFRNITAKDVYNQWVDSEGHFATMMDKDLKYIGFSIHSPINENDKPFGFFHSALVGRRKAEKSSDGTPARPVENENEFPIMPPEEP